MKNLDSDACSCEQTEEETCVNDKEYTGHFWGRLQVEAFLESRATSRSNEDCCASAVPTQHFVPAPNKPSFELRWIYAHLNAAGKH